ncbi:Uu.00g098040.m01.CDS01 [Anthostomella pinea]|uniref:Uu.00g098040.m01.CDS01 n=1 Tax=Anthostomella pinea TaxID=933095 RepID=A0AAI8YF30_9PEZI|nr:Uu.00g098040.m01.CDS01 [Anthostomella pinea]
MPETNPLAQSSASAEVVSKTTLPIAGLQVDIYGLSELPANATSISCLWLHHPRLRTKDMMAYIANASLSAFHSSSTAPTTRGLIAVAFDQRNHGSRIIDPVGNESWKKGNKTHAQDMFGTVSGTMLDTTHLLDALEGYLFGAGDGPGAAAGGQQRRIDQNMVLGISLGGHSAWQLMFAEPRVNAGVMVIGCPDYMNIMQSRAELEKLQTSTADNKAMFLGSKDFPDALIAACKKYDPKGILFGTRPISSPVPASEQDRIRPLLDSKIRGKRFQVLSGRIDKLVPYSAAAPFLEFFKDAVGTWYKDGGVSVEDIVYDKTGHTFSDDMKKDALRFILETVAVADDSAKAASSKI